jgi:RNA polymerase sigma-70 factor (ECF subfamily)
MSARKIEKALVARMIAGEERAFEEFADGYLPQIYRFVHRKVSGDTDLANEIVQSTLCKAIAKLSSFRGEAALTTWICACSMNELAAHFRRKQKVGTELEFQEVEDMSAQLLGEHRSEGFEGPESAMLQRETADLVHDALDALPPHYGQVLEWKYLESLSVNEIAKRLDLGLKATESLLTRARQSFRSGYAGLTSTVRLATEETRFVSQRMGFES